MDASRNEFPEVKGIDTGTTLTFPFPSGSVEMSSQGENLSHSACSFIIILFTEKAVYTCCVVAFSPH